MRAQNPEHLSEVAQLLEEVFPDSPQIDPRAVQVLEQIRTTPPRGDANGSSWSGGFRRLHPLGTIVTRTRKRDVVENAPVRRAFTERCDWTAAEDEAYQRLVEGSQSGGWPQTGMTIGQVQRARQAASCLPAAYAHRGATLAGHEALAESWDVDGLQEYDDEALPLPSGGVVDYGAWYGTDSKYKKLLEILADIWKAEAEAKVLVFTYFRGTARYLEKSLLAAGLTALRVMATFRPIRADRTSMNAASAFASSRKIRR